MSWGQRTVTATKTGTKKGAGTVTITCGPCRLSAEVPAKEAEFHRRRHADLFHGGSLWGGR